ncbi:MAG TPA: hypothetical protein VL354_12040 [Spirochaetia bacterium]|nr:hypothetical protein [Spirochaetia bacterium]
MSSADIALVFKNAAKTVPATESRPVLRIALLPGELLRIPRGRRHVHVLSGTAWISECTKDTVADRGSCVRLARSRHPALVSGAGSKPLLFEIW